MSMLAAKLPSLCGSCHAAAKVHALVVCRCTTCLCVAAGQLVSAVVTKATEGSLQRFVVWLHGYAKYITLCNGAGSSCLTQVASCLLPWQYQARAHSCPTLTRVPCTRRASHQPPPPCPPRTLLLGGWYTLQRCVCIAAQNRLASHNPAFSDAP